VAKVRERLAVNKERSQTFLMEIFNLKELKDVECREKYNVEVGRFAALEDLDAELEIKNAWERIRESIKILTEERLGCCELKEHKPWFKEGCSKLQWCRIHVK
jgi:hypothetical protein